MFNLGLYSYNKGLIKTQYMNNKKAYSLKYYFKATLYINDAIRDKQLW